MLRRYSPVRASSAAVLCVSLAVASAAAVSFVSACSPNGGAGAHAEADAGDLANLERRTGNAGLPPPGKPDYVNEDSGAFGPGNRPKKHSAGEDAGVRSNLGDSGGDPGLGGDPPSPNVPSTCVDKPLGPGDLVIVEIMVHSTDADGGDPGEYVELQNSTPCPIHLGGIQLAVSAPGAPPVFLPATPPAASGDDAGSGDFDGAAPIAGAPVAHVDYDSEITGYKMVLVATHPDAASLAKAPAFTIGFDGAPTDLLPDTGGTITLTANGTTIDSLTYLPFSADHDGTSISFPADCAWADRLNWQRWSYSSNVFFNPLKGTPGSDNTDVSCY